MVAFASPEWIAELDAVARTVAAGTGPALRVRYRFTADDTGPEAGYDLLFADQVRAEAPPTDPGDAVTVTVTQPRRIAREVAAGRLAAQKALLDGSVAVAGAVTALSARSAALHALDAALGPLRVRTDWS